MNACLKRISRILVITALAAIPFGKNNIQAANSISLAEYKGFVDSLAIAVDYRALAEDMKTLKADLKKLPPKMSVRIPVSQDQTTTVNFSLNWMRNYIETHSKQPPGIEHVDWDQQAKEIEAAENLAILLNRESTYLEELYPKEDWDAKDKEALQKILNDDLYDEEDKEEEEKGSGAPEWLRNALQKIGQALDWIVVICVILVGGYLLYRFSKFLDFRKVKKEVTIGKGQLIEVEDPRDYKGMSALAREAAKEGDLVRSVRYHYLALILLLHEAQVLPYNPSLTNWEYHRLMVAKQIPEDSSFLLTAVFDSSHYGEKPVTDSEFQKFSEEWEKCKGRIIG